jgi:pyruvate dehydrogenase E1 component alpha subunit
VAAVSVPAAVTGHLEAADREIAHRRMIEIRLFEQTVSKLFYKGELPGFVHLYIGEEAVAVGACLVLNTDDFITSTHRGHGHLIAKGADLRRMMAELYARSTGYCKGKGGSMHIADFSLGIAGANGIVGGGMPIAAGLGLGAQLLGDKRVAVAFFGDGGANQGTFHESLNLASIWKLPVIFICENNGFTEWTPYRELTAIDRIGDRASSYTMPGFTVDGNDVEAMAETVRKAVQRARAGEGPTLIEAQTYRWHAHNEGEEAFVGRWGYRTKDELETWKQRDPIALLEGRMIEAGQITADRAQSVRDEVQSEIDAAVVFAKESPLPEPSEVTSDLFSATHS